MRGAVMLLALAACATAEPEPTPERPLVACGPSYCTVDRGFFAAMTTELEECQARRQPEPAPANRPGVAGCEDLCDPCFEESLDGVHRWVCATNVNNSVWR